jgi:hypothetical protein
MKLRSAELAERRERLLLRIAAQRADLERQLLVWRGPIQAFDVARQAGQRLRKQATVAVAVIGALMVLTRGRGVGKVFVVLRLARFAAKWWAFGRMLYKMSGGFGRGPAPRVISGRT